MYAVYLGALIGALVAMASAVLFILLPAFGIYWVVAKFVKCCKWIGLVAGILFAVLCGGYIWAAFFCHFMDYLAEVVYLLAS